MIFKLINLYSALRTLGLRCGFRYWRLMCAAINDPAFAIKWTNAMRSEANREDVMGRHSDADFFRAYAAEIERCNAAYHNR